MMSMLVDEEEYETPAFLANTIPLDTISPDIIFTYETTESTIFIFYVVIYTFLKRRWLCL